MTSLALLRIAELRWACGLDESSFPGDFITLRCSDKSYLIQGLSESYMCEHKSANRFLNDPLSQMASFKIILDHLLFFKRKQSIFFYVLP